MTIELVQPDLAKFEELAKRGTLYAVRFFPPSMTGKCLVVGTMVDRSLMETAEMRRHARRFNLDEEQARQHRAIANVMELLTDSGWSASEIIAGDFTVETCTPQEMFEHARHGAERKPDAS